MCVLPSLTACQRSGQTRDRLSPGSDRWASLPQAPPSRRSGWQDAWSSRSTLSLSLPGAREPPLRSASPSSQPGGAGAEPWGCRDLCGPPGGGAQPSFPLCDAPSPPTSHSAVRPWHRGWPRGSGEGTDAGWEPPVCGHPPLWPLTALWPQCPRHHFTDEGTGVPWLGAGARRKAQKPRCPPRHEPPAVWGEQLGVRGLAEVGGRVWLRLWQRPQPKGPPRFPPGQAPWAGATLRAGLGPP